jgi:hypothetical protein
LMFPCPSVFLILDLVKVGTLTILLFNVNDTFGFTFRCYSLPSVSSTVGYFTRVSIINLL